MVRTFTWQALPRGKAGIFCLIWMRWMLELCLAHHQQHVAQPGTATDVGVPWQLP